MTTPNTLRRFATAPLLLNADNFTHQMWGGDWIPTFKNLPRPDRQVGESWELSCRPERPSLIETPDGQRVSLLQLAEAWPTEVLGRASTDGRCPLLLKFIDSRDDLSVQVHPSDEAAHDAGEDAGKAEAWLVLGTTPGEGQGGIYVGFNPDKAAGYATADDFREAFLGALNQANGQGPSDDPAVRTRAERLVLPFLNRIPVRAGDVVRLDPGTVHAIGRGVQLFEIQQNSDVTYRVWDWNRPDPEARKEGRLQFRALHLDRARRVLDFSPRRPEFYRSSIRVAGEGEESLVTGSDHRFELARSTFKAGEERTWDLRGRFWGVTLLSGELEIRAASGSIVLNPGRTAFLPAACGTVAVMARISSVALRSFVP